MKLNVSRLLDIIYQEPDDRAKIEDTVKKNAQKMEKCRLDHREQISEKRRKYRLDHKGLTKEEVSELLEETVK